MRLFLLPLIGCLSVTAWSWKLLVWYFRNGVQSEFVRSIGDMGLSDGEIC